MTVPTSLQGCIPDNEVSAAAKEAAKAHFKCAQYGDACQSYTRALQMLHESPAGTRDETASALYADRALCLLRLVPPAGAAAYADCTAAVASDNRNHKVLPGVSSITGHVTGIGEHSVCNS